MKTIIFFSILFSVIALPALGTLTDADLDKIRLIVKEEIKAESTEIKKDLKEDIASLRMEFKEDIAAVKKTLEEDIAKSEQNVKEQITILTYFVYALIALIVAAIAIPQIIVLWRSERERSLAKQVEILAEEVETLKQQRILNP